MSYRSMRECSSASGGSATRARDARSERAPALEQPDDHHHDGDHEQDVDQAAQVGKGDVAQQPEEDQQDGDGLEHGGFTSSSLEYAIAAFVPCAPAARMSGARK